LLGIVTFAPLGLIGLVKAQSIDVYYLLPTPAGEGLQQNASDSRGSVWGFGTSSPYIGGLFEDERREKFGKRNDRFKGSRWDF
jgi:hypothetical protein